MDMKAAIKRTTGIAKAQLPGVQEYDKSLAECLLIALQQIEVLQARIETLEQRITALLEEWDIRSI